MATEPTILGSPATVVWGSDGGAGDYDEALVISARDQATGEEREIKGNKGFTAVLVLFDDKNECELTIVMDSAITPPARGTFVTICGVANVIIKQIESAWQSSQEGAWTFRGTKYADIAPAA